MHMLKMLKLQGFLAPGSNFRKQRADSCHRLVMEISRATVTYTIVTVSSCLEGSTTLRMISYPNSSRPETLVISFKLKRSWDKELV